MPKNCGLNVSLQEICAYPVSRDRIVSYLAKRPLGIIKDLKSILNISVGPKSGDWCCLQCETEGNWTKRNINRYIERVKIKEDFQMLRPQAKECQCWEHPESSFPLDTHKLL